MKPRPRKVIFFEGNSLTPVSFLHEYMFVSHICCYLSQAIWREGDQGDFWCPGNHGQHSLTARISVCIWSFFKDFFFSIKDLYLGRPVPNHLSKEQFHYEKLIPLFSVPLGEICSLVDLVQHKWKLLSRSYKLVWSLRSCLVLWISCCLTTYALVWHVICCKEMQWSTSLKFLHT